MQCALDTVTLIWIEPDPPILQTRPAQSRRSRRKVASRQGPRDDGKRPTPNALCANVAVLQACLARTSLCPSVEVWKAHRHGSTSASVSVSSMKICLLARLRCKATETRTEDRFPFPPLAAVPALSVAAVSQSPASWASKKKKSETREMGDLRTGIPPHLCRKSDPSDTISIATPRSSAPFPTRKPSNIRARRGVGEVVRCDASQGK